LNGIQEVDGSIPFSSTTLEAFPLLTYTDPALSDDLDETPEIEGRRSCFARPVAATLSPLIWPAGHVACEGKRAARLAHSRTRRARYRLGER